MIYSKLDGTTSKKFKLGKNGVEIQDQDGKLVVQEHNGPARTVGVSDIRTSPEDQTDNIPTVGAVTTAISEKIRTVTEVEKQNLINSDNLKTGDYLFVEKGGN